MLWTCPARLTDTAAPGSGVDDTHTVPAPPIDRGVYSKHRSFRLLWSSKRKPNAPVLHCHHTQQYNRAVSQRTMWMHSCVQFMEADKHSTSDDSSCTVLTWPPHRTDSDRFSEHYDHVDHIKNRNNNSRPMSDSSSSAFDPTEAVNSRELGMQPSRTHRRSLTGSCLIAVRQSTCLLDSDVWGPAVQLLQQFMSDPHTWPAEPAAASLTLRSHSAVVAGRYGADDVYRVTLVFSVSGSRYCARVGRAHRSNSIYFVGYVNNATRLRATLAAPTTITATHSLVPSPTTTSTAPSAARTTSAPAAPCQTACFFVQRCHDVDCSGFSSAPVTLPAQLVRSLTEQLHDRTDP